MCVCMCVRSLSGLPFSTDPINPPIFRAFRSLWLLQTFGWPLVCVAVWLPPRTNACNSRVPLIPFLYPFIREAVFSPSPVIVPFVHPGLIPLVDHRQSNSIHLSCHQFLSSLSLSLSLSVKVIKCFFFNYPHFTLHFSLPPSLTRNQ